MNDSWISVDERLPESSADSFVWAVWHGAGRFKHPPKQGEARYMDGLGWQPSGSTGWGWEVSHWQPLPKLPEPPKE